MIPIYLTVEPHGQSMSFDETVDVMYKLFKDKSLRVFGISGGDEGDVQLKRGFFKNSLEVYLPDDVYDIAHVSEIVDIIDQSFLSVNS